jgi:F-type H+-transporting ATPase subunit alpha
MSEPMRRLADVSEHLFETLDGTLARHQARLSVEEIGTVAEVGAGIAHVAHLTDVKDQEVIQFPHGLFGIAIDLAVDDVGVALLGHYHHLSVGAQARRTGRALDVPIGEGLLGRVVNGIGQPIDEKGPVRAEERWAVERPVPPIIARSPVSVPLQTGIKAIDAAIPIGRGQRQLILGDRQTGKTSIAVDTLLQQRGTGVIGIYCAIGQRNSAVARVVATLRAHGALDRTIVVVASGDEPPALQFVAPYAATTMAEFFMQRGQDVVIIYDDLTRHARAYRELSLLLRRPPGREAYPGDIFFVHSRLLERATHLAEEHGGGSLTALPIIETQAQNIAAYIPTNLISITDGQIYLSPDLFHKGQLPAIDIGRSVSRVGGKAQLPAFRAVAADLRLSYAQFEEFETFARFGTRLDPETRRALERGRRVREILKQSEHDLQSVSEQIVVLFAATQGLLDHVPARDVAMIEKGIRARMWRELSDLCERIDAGHSLDAHAMAQMRSAVEAAVREHVGARHTGGH